MGDYLLQSSKKPSTKAYLKRESKTEAMTPLEILCDQPEKINPAILLAEELMRKNIAEVFDLEDIEKAQETLEYSRLEINRVEAQFIAIVKTKPRAGRRIPIGF